MNHPVAAPRAAGANLVCFQLASQSFGCSITSVKETVVVRPITRVFLTPSWVAGIINLRGDIVCVIDLANFLGLAPFRPGAEARIIITRSQDKTVGLLVDRLTDVRTADLARLEPPPTTLPSELATLLMGFVTLPDGVPLAILDLDRLFDSERLRSAAPRAQGA